MACKKHPGPPFAVDRFQIAEESLAAAPALGLGTAQFQKAIEDTLLKQGAGVLKRGSTLRSDTPLYKLRAEVEYARELDSAWPDGGTGRQDEVSIALELIPTVGDREARVVGPGVGLVPAPATNADPDARGAAFQTALHQAVEEATAVLVRGALARAKESSALEADLQSPDAGIREAAADVLVDRHDLAAVPVLIEELSNPDDRVKMKSVGELVELKARAAVPQLIELTESKDPNHDVDPHLEVQIIYALGSIGGDDAEAYLYTISSGHPDEMVRRAATEASAELRSHRGPSKSETDAADARAAVPATGRSP
jgi:hypothetical protein